MSEPRIEAFPWQRVQRLERAAVLRRRELLRALETCFDARRAATALEQLLGIETKAELALELAAPGDAAPDDSWLTLRVPAHDLRIDVQPEPDLVRCAVARLLAQDFELGWADAGVDPPLAGAGAALLLEVARRAAESEAPELALPGGMEPGFTERCLAGRLTLWLGGKPYRAEVRVRSSRAHGAPGLARRARVERLGDARICVPWVCAVSSIEAQAALGLRAGDIWLPGAAAWLGADAALSGVLAAPRADRGMPVRVSSGRIVLGANAVRVHEELESTMSHQESELEQIVGETPLVVRLEIGALEMTASEWAALRPGDVVQSGRRLEDPVILRAGGCEIARGELVDIEGEVGVRITQVGAARVAP